MLLPTAPGRLQVLTGTDDPLLAHEITDRDVREVLDPPFTIDALAGWTHLPAVAVDLARASGTRFVTATPISTPGGPGALVMLSRYRTLFPEDDITVFSELAAQAAALARRAAVLAEREHLAVIVESSPDAIVARTPDGVITSWNAGAERLYGYTAAEVIGRDAITLFGGT
ncbi:PAS domain S-box protein [Actinoplanes missouriensis]|uniref:PAS domain S-box protein n=1 Tax=Actinoplanes missouriensis TaxID=1866 RepID=UPI0033E219FC